MRATDAPAAAPQDTPTPRGKRPRWPFIVAGLLVVHVMAMTVAVLIATHDRSFAVLPNYYDNAVHWDQDQAKRRASEKLGWKLEIIPSETIDPLGRRNVSLRLTDANDQPLAAIVEVNYFHHSHANDPQTLTATTSVDGRASIAAPMRYAGFYDFRCTASSGGQTFTATLTQFVINADTGSTVAKGAP